jgi:hypothetical protein
MWNEMCVSFCKIRRLSFAAIPRSKALWCPPRVPNQAVMCFLISCSMAGIILMILKSEVALIDRDSISMWVHNLIYPLYRVRDYMIWCVMPVSRDQTYIQHNKRTTCSLLSSTLGPAVQITNLLFDFKTFLCVEIWQAWAPGIIGIQLSYESAVLPCFID